MPPGEPEEAVKAPSRSRRYQRRAISESSLRLLPFPLSVASVWHRQPRGVHVTVPPMPRERATEVVAPRAAPFPLSTRRGLIALSAGILRAGTIPSLTKGSPNWVNRLSVP